MQPGDSLPYSHPEVACKYCSIIRRASAVWLCRVPRNDVYVYVYKPKAHNDTIHRNPLPSKLLACVHHRDKGLQKGGAGAIMSCIITPPQ